jgi:hypothetical protein
MHSSFRIRQGFLTSVLLWFCSVGSITNTWANEINLAWSPNPESTVTGYKVHYGMSSRSYGALIDVGSVTSYSVTGLGSGNYYFAITAYDNAGHESGFSNEASATTSSTTPGGSACDINGDGGHNVLDLQTVINAILGGSSSASFDVNRDSAVNALDLQTLGNVVLGVSICP